MNTDVGVSLSLGVMTFIFINVFFEVKFFQGLGGFLLNLFDHIAESIGKNNLRRYIARKKREKIVKEKENLFFKYNRFVENLIFDFDLPITQEGITSMLCIAFVVIVLIVTIFMRNVTLSVVMTVFVFVGLLTAFVMQTKRAKSQKIEEIMDAEDVICPMAHEGILVAIKKVMETDEYIAKSIRPYFEQFIDNCENNGYSFRQAITLLNRQLGHKFDNFTKKAILFEYNERKGMADIFMDIVDENALLREMNDKKDRVFRKMNRDFLLKTAIIVLFFLYALSVPDFKSFMLGTDFGKLLNTALVSVICLSFARCQALQSDLAIGGAGT